MNKTSWPERQHLSRAACGLTLAIACGSAPGGALAQASPGQIAASQSSAGVYTGNMWSPNQLPMSWPAAPSLFRGGQNCGFHGAKDKPSPQGPPEVVSTFPAPGSVVRPGLVVVRVTFDKPMSCDASFGGSTAPGGANPCPSTWTIIDISRDQRSFREICKVEANQHYVLPVVHFRSQRKVLMKPKAVAFSTSGAAKQDSLQQALAEDTDAAKIVGG